jgi:hypothetical protein
MLSKEPNLPKSHINRIRELIPNLDLNEIPALAKISPEEISLSSSNRVYYLGLDSLLKKHSTPRIVSLRIFGSKNESPIAFFDAAVDGKDVIDVERRRTVPRRAGMAEGENPRIRHMAVSKKYHEAYTKAWKKALSIVEESEKEFQLRLLRVPTLNFEAVWIYSEGRGEDRLVPLRNVGRLIAYEPVPYDQALESLREAARPWEDADETMGG